MLYETWKNLFKKAIRYLDEATSPVDQEGKIRWGISGAIDTMMESRPKVGFAADTAKIARLYGADPGAALERYGGQQMEFRGTVVQCQKTYGSHANPWAVRVNVKEIDVIIYLPGAIHAGREITIDGTCVGFQCESRVAVVLDPAAIR